MMTFEFDGKETRGRSFLEVKDMFYRNCKRVIGDGKSTSFWDDCWCGKIPLSVRFKDFMIYLLTKR
jgi:predicted metal-binding transcription factor (methanogenesis marker protein 9)